MSNVSNEEIQKFNDQDWWNTEGELKTLHDINPTRFEFMEDCVELAGKKALDIGCGGGIISEGLAHRHAKVTGIDMAPNAIEVANHHAKSHHLEIDYQVITAEEFAKDHIEKFDVITCLEMLEHVPTPSSVIKAASDMLKPGGSIFFSTINRTFKAKSLAVFAAENVLRIVPKGTHDYNKFITPLELYEMCEAYGLTVKRIQGMSYNPFNRVAGLTDDVSMNYLVYATKDRI
ncbi:bifunctional 2-polyprenyl-6-hydroxyphenol methylase/3-demethylubiquinol 3-O-methyltransferase UbiG [Ignatzschineria rhizosphaerae]|uniref:Ubiquinone biosynthesis O-methyltransferase n=1 Tax=Ignatzschineria rhizosphaerae TaxID=2923279 RepID=A0ABY3X0R7_9GAMM|nr:bifunctional 2-polyprenyl-6-hydroxyphenol methylase/3-demethylubiquinol 3-O-methyltransferase UbiG [Ignatzschineria rhizosphaerae]UNM96461.1 bifunctional 2-polyprenyl-6-hydroxyphenol methylase/3-demethylubiquinol 3-O-methyltransferase UbiG [Ignatzschineria rhizosphaerae]